MPTVFNETVATESVEALRHSQAKTEQAGLDNRARFRELLGAERRHRHAEDEGAACGVSGAAGNGDRAGRADYPEGKAAAGDGRRNRAKGSRLHHLP